MAGMLESLFMANPRAFSVDDIAAAMRGDLLNEPDLPIKYGAKPGQRFGEIATANAEPFNSIVAHHTGSPTLDSALSTSRGDPFRGGDRFGYHFYIDKDGSITQGAPLDARTNHVQSPGSPMRTDRPDIENKNAIGVSFVGQGEAPTREQQRAAENLSKILMRRFNIDIGNVVGHGEIQKSRRPAEGMPLVNALRSTAGPVLASAGSVSDAPPPGLIPEAGPLEIPMPRPRPQMPPDPNAPVGLLAPALAAAQAQPQQQAQAPAAGMLAGLFGGPAPFATPPAGFDALDAANTPAPTGDLTAEGARTAAAGRMARSVKRPTVFDRGADAIPGIDAVAAMLSGGGGSPAAPNMDVATGNEFERPPTNDPQAGEPQQVSDVPLPRPRPNGIGDDPGVAPLALAPDALPPKAGMVTGPAPPGMELQAPAGPSLFDRIFDPNKASTWMALGSGFAGAGSIGSGMRKAFGNAVPAMVADRAHATKQSGVAATYRALIAKGVPPAEALAASQNPDIMKVVAAKYFEAKPLVPHKVGQDWLGNDVMGSFNPNTGKWYDTAGREISGPGGSTGGAAAPGGIQMLAKGVDAYSSELGGDDYLNQFSPEIKAAIQSYVRGDTMPTGNPRLKGMEGKVKEWARLYGDKTGVPVSDATFAERRKFRTELGSASASTAGGQTKAFNQGIEHAEALAKQMEKLGNYDPVGIPAVAYGINWTRQKFSSKQTGIANEAAAIGQTLAGEVGKLFSGSQGGGVHERELTRQRFNTISTPYELAGALDATLETMEGGLRALEHRRDSVLGPNNNVTLVPAETHAKIAKIRETINRLRSGESPAAAPAAPKPGNYVFDPATKKLVPAQ